MTYYGIEVDAKGRHQVYATEDGIVRVRLADAVYDKPRQAVEYAEMRQQEISPRRVDKAS